MSLDIFGGFDRHPLQGKGGPTELRQKQQQQQQQRQQQQRQQQQSSLPGARTSDGMADDVYPSPRVILLDFLQGSVYRLVVKLREAARGQATMRRAKSAPTIKSVQRRLLEMFNGGNR